MEGNFLHKSVLLHDAIDFLNLAPGKLIVDATVGGGGHAEEILKRITPGGRLIAIDRDMESLNMASQRLKGFTGSFTLLNKNFRHIKDILKNIKMESIDGIIFDLGISSIQMETGERGFSIKENSPLDMRMDRNQSLTAKDLINKGSEDELSRILRDFGEERFHKRIARAIVRQRAKKRIETTRELAELISRNVPPYYRHQRLHPATRAFQALRIKVNDELGAIEEALKDAPFVLKKGGRVCVISFHSLEDRIVKNTFRMFEREGVVKIITKKPVAPAAQEVCENPRSRSAKMRVAERI